jgi:hypothetical protein
MLLSKWANASQKLQSLWTTQQDVRIATLEKQLKQVENENKRLATALTASSQRCVELEVAIMESSSMLWNVTKPLVFSRDFYDRPIVRLPAVVAAVSGLPLGSQLTTEANLEVGRVVARIPAFRHITKTDVITENGSQREVNMFEESDLPVLLPVLFQWIEKQPFTVWEDPFPLVAQRLVPYFITDIVNIMLEFLGAPEKSKNA